MLESDSDLVMTSMVGACAVGANEQIEGEGIRWVIAEDCCECQPACFLLCLKSYQIACPIAFTGDSYILC